MVLNLNSYENNDHHPLSSRKNNAELAKKVLILTSDTGGGHASAARAIEAGLRNINCRLDFLVHISRVIEESHFISRQTVFLYNFLLRHYQSYVKYYHWLINRYNPDRSLYHFYRRYIGQLVSRYCPNLIVSVHPMVQHGISRILQDLNLTDRIPLATVVTDPCGNSWKGWASESVKLYLVAHEVASQELISYGVLPERIRICGMPIHPKFEQAAEQLERQAMRRELGLDPEKFTVFINSGWVGGGNIPRIFASLAEAKLNIQAIFLAGKNKRLQAEATQIGQRAPFPVKVVGYSDKMEKLMCAANVMISKLGGLTTFEALACRLPIIMDNLTPPMPQESGIADWIAANKAGIRLTSTSDIVPIVRHLLEDYGSCQSMSLAAQRLAVPDATQRIVEQLTTLLTPSPLISTPA
jgi:UDP-N-acetylglucosamine:LPS N-acetylglucosamine transferase